jgi:hypothetical protein
MVVFFVNVPAFALALQRQVNRQDSLRTAYEERDEICVQIVQGAGELEV